VIEDLNKILNPGPTEKEEMLLFNIKTFFQNYPLEQDHQGLYVHDLGGKIPSQKGDFQGCQGFFFFYFFFLKKEEEGKREKKERKIAST